MRIRKNAQGFLLTPAEVFASSAVKAFYRWSSRRKAAEGAEKSQILF